MTALPTTISGNVRKNLGRGTQLGYPTANVDYEGDLPDGVYLAYTTINTGEKLHSLAFIGAAETFNATDRKMEVYILDFKGDLYNSTISVELLKHTRGNMKFNSIEDLIERIKKDEVEGREYFKLH
jgi:riboflavin kinase/FMN adenylyltransferase